MTAILHDAIPDDMSELRALPGVQPLQGPWLRVDEAYAGQMARRRSLIAEREAAVYRMDRDAEPACAEALAEALTLLPGLGYAPTGGGVRCPDGVVVPLEGPPLLVLGRLVQADICIMEKRGDEHVLTAAILCFPASWHIEEKFMRPLTGIHGPVEAYNASIATRVQRLFDGVQVGRPMWRFNRLTYLEPELHQPRREADRRIKPIDRGQALFERAERQCVVRLPDTRAVVFAIHTYVAKRSR